MIDQLIPKLRRTIVATRGQGLVEYGLLIALVSVAAIAALLLLGDTIVDQYTEVNCALENQGDPACTTSNPALSQAGQSQAAQATGPTAAPTATAQPGSGTGAGTGGGTGGEYTPGEHGGGGTGGAIIPPTATPIPTATPQTVTLQADMVGCNADGDLLISVNVYNAPNANLWGYIRGNWLQINQVTKQPSYENHARTFVDNSSQARAYCQSNGAYYTAAAITFEVRYDNNAAYTARLPITRP